MSSSSAAVRAAAESSTGRPVSAQQQAKCSRRSPIGYAKYGYLGAGELRVNVAKEWVHSRHVQHQRGFVRAHDRPSPSSPTHIVQEGDSLYKIARKYDVAMSSLSKENNIPLKRVVLLKPGQELQIPVKIGGVVLEEGSLVKSAGQVITAQEGDTWSSIARRVGTNASELKEKARVERAPRQLVICKPFPAQPATNSPRISTPQLRMVASAAAPQAPPVTLQKGVSVNSLLLGAALLLPAFYLLVTGRWKDLLGKQVSDAVSSSRAKVVKAAEAAVQGAEGVVSRSTQKDGPKLDESKLPPAVRAQLAKAKEEVEDAKKRAQEARALASAVTEELQLAKEEHQTLLKMANDAKDVWRRAREALQVARARFGREELAGKGQGEVASV